MPSKNVRTPVGVVTHLLGSSGVDAGSTVGYTPVSIIAGRYVGKAATYAALPSTHPSGGPLQVGDHSELTADDGANLSGTYRWNGTSWVFEHAGGGGGASAYRDFTISNRAGMNGAGRTSPVSPPSPTPTIGDVHAEVYDDLTIYYTAVAANWTAPTVVEVYGYPRSVNAQVGTSYTTVVGDSGNVVTLNNASAVTVTLSNLAPGSSTTFISIGAGAVTFVSGTLTRRQRSNLYQIAGQYGVVAVTVVGSNAIISGDVS